MPASPNLPKYLAASGVTSRRNAEMLVRSGHVSVNGRTETNPARRIEPGDTVECDHTPVNMPERRHYILLNKPRGYVCTNADPHAELKALDLVRLPGVRLFSAGRLDMDSEGALILSDDGDYVAKLTHPRHGVLKRYLVETSRPLRPAELELIRRGVEDDGELLRVHSITPLGGPRYEFVLNEGRKREIRRITAAAGAPTVNLCRVAIGHLELGALPSGKWRELTEKEIAASLADTEA